MNYTKISLDKATLHIYKTQKFKKISIDVLLSDKVDETNLSYRTLLSRVMESKSKKYSTKRDINRKLDMLYGANFGISSSKIGLATYIDASIDGVNPRYVLDDKLLSDMLEFLYDMIFYPSFDTKNVNEEKRLLLDDYKLEYENKSALAAINSNRIAFSNELARFKANGEEEIVKNITNKELEEYYNYVINNNKVDIIICGDVDDSIIDTVKKYFDFGVKKNIDIIDYEEKILEEVIYKKDKTKSNQSQLVVKYRCYTRIGDADYLAMLLFERILGGFSSSLLFTNVREKNSLCYSISSVYATFKGVITIVAGINKENYDSALKLIFEQVDSISQGNFSNELLEMARLSILSSIKKSGDSLPSIAKKIYTSEILKKEFALDEYVLDIQKLTKEDIVRVANKLKLDIVYLLEGSDTND